MSNYPLNISIKAKNYKCFGDEAQGFEVVKPLNLIIGRNNSGKSALIDLVKYFTLSQDLSVYGHKTRRPEFFFSTPLTDTDINRSFNPGMNWAHVGSVNEYAMTHYLGKRINIKVQYGGEPIFQSIDDSDQLAVFAQLEHQHNFKATLSKNLDIPLKGKVFKKIGAERDIRPEVENINNVVLNDDGTGATNLIQVWLNRHDRKASLIEKDLLAKLNEIFQPDGTFTRILVKKKPDETWEVYLEEENKGLISLSNSGSGLKTIILVLLNTIVLPTQENIPLSQYVFAFEELENNLHPALLRRLLVYITNLQKQADCCFVLTTHSSVTIDFFGRNDDAQIIHVRNDGSSALVTQTLTYVDNIGILNDLDVRASDLLQSNGIIWVEGPSDRTYIKKWIDLWSGGTIEEGIHYQCLMYGGKLLFHLSADDPDEVNKAISILRANRNFILLMDSDKDKQEKALNATKRRILEEAERMNGFVWVTAGREVENYTPVQALRELYRDTSLSGPKKFTKMPEYLKNKNLEMNVTFDKVAFSDKILPFLKHEDLQHVLDLDESVKKVCTLIKGWNGLPS